ncbi:unnamed protein product [Gongylonema pulchrum]|uniref:Uncharacterized protein n=1 Tax=Gongylonema pulchrum TaxID=637853 RepID=A0A3P7MWP8_9BILA|nr:unnamed protein product [Gongylonema pulchrum]
MFVSDTVDQYNDVSFGPLGGPDSAPYEKRCECGNGTMYYYKSVVSTSWFDILARAKQSVDLSCAAMGSMCVCDISDICYTATNSTVHAVLASYCSRDACDMYMLVEGDTDEEGLIPIDGGPVIKSGDQYAEHSTTPYMINSQTYSYKKISAIACGQCPIYRLSC